jgi:endonuclease-3
MKEQSQIIIESLPQKKKRTREIIRLLSKEYPAVTIQLEFTNNFELMVATILSAQCTDDRVNKVTEKLFKKYRSPQDYLDVPKEELEKDIFSTGYYKAKASHIRGAAAMILDKFGGKVPGTMEELLEIPGVGRKTANVLLCHSFNVPAIVVDTHVGRLANRLGLSASKDAYKIELDLMEVLPKNEWIDVNHYLINHGRKVCDSRKPKCDICVLSNLCPSAFGFSNKG